MATTTADLKHYVGAHDAEHDALLAACLAEAQALIDKYRTAGYDEDHVPVLIEIPEPVLDQATVEVGADLYHRRNAPNGISNAQFQTFDGVGAAAVRIARDPMAAAYKTLGRWVTPW